MSYPKRRSRVDDRDGVAVHVVDDRPGPLPHLLPGCWTEAVHCGGPGRCARQVLGKIPYIPSDATEPTRPDVVMLTIDLERIRLPAVVRCPKCGTRRRVESAPVHHPRPQ